jgi:hypothetical protein
LHILSLSKPATDVVQADVYLLTDRAPSLLGLDQGVQLKASEPASTSLLADLRSDKDSGWVPDQAWLTFLRVDTPAARLGHDLAIDATGAGRPSAVQAGYNPLSSAPPALTARFAPVAASPGDSDRWIATAVAAMAVAAAAGVALAVRARSRATHPA